MHLYVSLPILRRTLCIILAVISCAGFAVELWDESRAWPVPRDILAFFSLSYESNLPTWYSSSLLWSCAVLIALIANYQSRQRAPYIYHWWILAAAFFYISLDESVELHEDMSNWMDLGGGVLYFSWIVPAGIAVAAFGLAYLKFLAHLPWDTRRRFILSGSLYVGGALLMELPLGYWTDLAGPHNFTYALLDWIEETLEMAGLSVFGYSLLLHIESGIQLTDPPDQTETVLVRSTPPGSLDPV